MLLAASYVLFPGIARRFLNNPKTRDLFEKRNTTWIEKIPISVLALSYVIVFFIIILHAQIYFNGIFPLFGVWLTGLEGIILIDVSIVLLLVLIWGLIRIKRLAWCGVLFYFCLTTLSYIITLMRSSWMEILSILNLPPFEIEFLQGIPLEGYHLAILAGLPFFWVICLILRARSGFKVPSLYS
jgi:hypothetical protein